MEAFTQYMISTTVRSIISAPQLQNAVNHTTAAPLLVLRWWFTAFCSHGALMIERTVLLPSVIAMKRMLIMRQKCQAFFKIKKLRAHNCVPSTKWSMLSEWHHYHMVYGTSNQILNSDEWFRKLPAFHRSKRFTTVLTGASLWSTTSGFPTKNLYEFLFCPMCATRLILFDICLLLVLIFVRRWVDPRA
jgi:hypothetical protein